MIDEEAFLLLDEAALTEMVKALGPRKKFMKKLQEEQDVPGEDPEAIPPNVDGGNEHILAKEDVRKLAASTLAKLKASSSVVQSTVDNVVSETSSLFFDVINTLQFKTAELLQGLGIHEDRMMIEGRLSWICLQNINTHMSTWKLLINNINILYKVAILLNHVKYHSLLHITLAIMHKLLMLFK
ncbi:hypothetical protein BSL78_17883 [Apostichopus japonicus]|uniref:Uncharacterized protein n=1 Tax=Stichopus japonicus TaxID=307972 RepID=A0A2G8KBA3_STIJA|nr:hypothetical protein BSL78_17883 [Apostichopus japonicus]